MQSNLPVIIFFVSFGLVFAVSLGEMALGAAWNPRYYTAGLLVNVFDIPVASYHTAIPSALLLESKNRSCLFGNLVFREIAPDTYGFRYRYLDLSLLRFKGVHGVLLFDRANHRVVLKSFLNLFATASVLFWLLISVMVGLGSGEWLYALAGFSIGVLLLGLFESIDLYFNSWRCKALVQFAAYAWSRKHVPSEAVGHTNMEGMSKA